MKNPFNPGSGTMPPFLAGRQSHLDTFRQMLDDAADGYNTNILLTGLRGVGKSTLMQKFEKIADDGGFAVVRRNQFGKKHSVPRNFLMSLSSDIREAASGVSRARRLTEGARKVGKLVRPKAVGLMGMYVELSYKDEQELNEDKMKRYLSSNWNIFEKAERKGVILLFDEFHEVTDLDKENTVLSDFVGVLNDLQHDGMPYYAVLAGLPNLELNIKRAKTYTERMFATLKVEYLPEEDARSAILEPLKKTGISFSDGLVDTVIQETKCYPFFIQFYCREIISNVGRGAITLSDFERVKDRIEKKLDASFFDRRFADTSDVEKRILFAMSSSNSEEVPIRTIIESGLSRGTLTKTLTRLERKGLVHRYGRGVYKLSLPLLGRYLRKKSRQG